MGEGGWGLNGAFMVNYVVVQVYPWFNFYVPLFYTLPYTKTERNKN